MNVSGLLESIKEPVHILGFVGQGVFFTRFLIQWIASEKRRESVIPIGFWYCSLCGGFLTLVYAILIASPPIILGQMFGLVVYIRNLMLVHRKRRQDREAAEAAA